MMSRIPYIAELFRPERRRASAARGGAGNVLARPARAAMML